MQHKNAFVPKNLLQLIQYSVLFFLTAIFAAEVVLGLQWRLLGDAPLLHYIAWLANEHDYVVYRDVFETSMPGTFIVHILIGKLFGYGDLAFRLVDLTWLICLMLVTWKLMNRFSTLVGISATLAFPIMYIAYGQAMAMQRDYLAILPIAYALLYTARESRSIRRRALIVGALFAAASTFKPQLGIGLPLVLVYLLTEPRGNATLGQQFLNVAIPATVGFLAVMAIPISWLVFNGALGDFWEMLTSYLPLHVHMTGAIETITPEQHVEYVQRKFIFGLQFYAPPAIMGLIIALKLSDVSKQNRRLIWLFAVLAVVYALNTALGGKFWEYHWLPFRYFAALCISFLFLPLQSFRFDKAVAAFLSLFFLVTLLIWVSLYGYTKHRLGFPAAFAAQVRGYPPPPPKGGKVDEIAEFLIAAELSPDDRVLPVDWTEGAVHAMLIAKALPATPYIYDYYFYHYVSEPYIQAIRQEHIAALKAHPPRFVIDVLDKLKPSGLDTTDNFPELDAMLQENYREVKSGKNYRILERISDS